MTSTRRVRFGIGVILFAMVVVAGYFWGLNSGETVRYNTTLSSVVYPVKNCLTGAQSIDVQLHAIVKLIKSTIAPGSWVEQGGMASLLIYPSNQSLVVNQFGAEHEKIRDLLDSLEKFASQEHYSVEYDVSEILNAGTQKSYDEQLGELCAITRQKFNNAGVTTVKFTPDTDSLTMRIVASKDLHNAISAYLAQLRGARRVFARIDGKEELSNSR